jgi:hypothetical protein
MQPLRAKLLGVLALGCVLLGPVRVAAQDAATPRSGAIEAEVRPRPGSIRLTAPWEAIEVAMRWTVAETECWRCQLFGTITPPEGGWLPHLGASNQWYLGNTPWGPFSASVDLHAAAAGGRVCVALYWYHSEDLFVSLQIDCLRVERLRLEIVSERPKR